MAVYFIVQEKVNDPEGLAEYGAKAGPTLAGTKSKALAVDNDVTVIEGDWHGSRVVVLEFEDEEAFRSWYYSPAYQEAVKLRFAATDSRGALVKGLE